MKRKPIPPKAVALLALKTLRQRIDAHIKRIKEIPDDAPSLQLTGASTVFSQVAGKYTLYQTWGDGKARMRCDEVTFDHVVRVAGDAITREAMK